VFETEKLHWLQVSALNVMQARVRALEQELEIERGQASSLQTK